MNVLKKPLLFLSYITSFLAYGQNSSNDSSSVFTSDSVDFMIEIDSIINNAILTHAFPGCQLFAVKKGEVIVDKAYGYHTYDSVNLVKKTDLYDLASLTKVTASTLALMKMHDDGLLDLDKSLGDYFPVLKRSNKRDITMREVLAHQGRIKAWIPYHRTFRKCNGEFKKRTVSSDSSSNYPHKIEEGLFLHHDIRSKVYKAIKKSRLNEKEGYVYSGLLFYLIPDLIERYYHMSFEDFLQTNFYKPLGAKTLSFNPLKTFDKHMIVPTEVDTFFRMSKIHGYVHDEGAIMMNGISGNAGLFGNAGDLAKVWTMLNAFGEFEGKRYLTAQTIIKFTSCQYCNKDNRRGLGFDKPLIEYDSLKSSVAKSASIFSFGHTGYTGTLVWADPMADLVYVFLSNRVYPTRENKKIYDLNVRPAIHEIFYGVK